MAQGPAISDADRCASAGPRLSEPTLWRWLKSEAPGLRPQTGRIRHKALPYPAPVYYSYKYILDILYEKINRSFLSIPTPRSVGHGSVNYLVRTVAVVCKGFNREKVLARIDSSIELMTWRACRISISMSNRQKKADTLCRLERLWRPRNACQNLRDVNQSILQIAMRDADTIAACLNLTTRRRGFTRRDYFKCADFVRK